MKVEITVDETKHIPEKYYRTLRFHHLNNGDKFVMIGEWHAWFSVPESVVKSQEEIYQKFTNDNKYYAVDIISGKIFDGRSFANFALIKLI